MENTENNPGPIDEFARQQQRIPKFYSEGAIMGFAFFCSTLFACFLTIENLKEANARRGILPVVIFVTVITGLEVLAVGILPQQFNFIGILFNLAGGMVLNLYFWKKYIPAGLPYEIKPIRKPLTIGLLLVAVQLLLLLASMEILNHKL